MHTSISKPSRTLPRVLMALGGCLSLAIGIAGIVLPVLPTTPFFLLSAYLFLRSSQRLYRWLLTHKLFGNYIRNYIHHKSISKGVKVFTLTLLWTTISLSIWMIRGLLWVQLLLAAIAIGVSVHVISLKTSNMSSKGSLIRKKRGAAKQPPHLNLTTKI